jgi:hypothetical protein
MNITVVHTIRVAAPVEMVFDLSQDWKLRHTWDRSVVSVEALAEEERAYRVTGRFRLVFEARYKLFRPHERTSLVMSASTWKVFTGGGGGWDYKKDGDGTLWTQTNTVTLEDGLLGSFLAPFFWLGVTFGTRASMRRFKGLVESVMDEAKLRAKLKAREKKPGSKPPQAAP